MEAMKEGRKEVGRKKEGEERREGGRVVGREGERGGGKISSICLSYTGDKSQMINV